MTEFQKCDTVKRRTRVENNFVSSTFNNQVRPLAKNCQITRNLLYLRSRPQKSAYHLIRYVARYTRHPRRCGIAHFHTLSRRCSVWRTRAKPPSPFSPTHFTTDFSPPTASCILVLQTHHPLAIHSASPPLIGPALASVLQHNIYSRNSEARS